MAEKMTSINASTIFILILFFISFTKGFECPDIPPGHACFCIPMDPKLTIYCTGYSDSNLTAAISEFFAATREANALGTDDWLEIQNIYISRNRNITTLDITPLMNARFDGLEIAENPNLISITGPQPVGEWAGKIAATRLDMDECALGNQGLGNFFQYFDTAALQYVSINSTATRKTSGKAAPGFLPGISEFTNLQYFFANFPKNK